MTTMLRTVAVAASLAAGFAAGFAAGADALAAPSASADFDRACVGYYMEGNDPEVDPAGAPAFCACLAEQHVRNGLRRDALDFLARTYTGDVTTFLQEYTSGDAWMEKSMRAEAACKPDTGGAGAVGKRSEAEPGETAGAFPRAAGSWGGIVRSGPGRQYERVDSLSEDERIVLLERTAVAEDGYPWLRIRYRGEREGYQWGGILCSLQGPDPDLFETCR